MHRSQFEALAVGTKGECHSLDESDKIVDAITQVSIQTNMLAVNGSIEAARAGEYGKGFVVVATDIRNLAHDSAENADRIKDMVKAIQDQIGFVGRDLSEIMNTALGEVERRIAAHVAGLIPDGAGRARPPSGAAARCAPRSSRAGQ